MNQYTIYCTEEQTKKAARLGAPILSFANSFVSNDIQHYYVGDVGIEWTAYVCPTAEQMICWLEEQGIQISTPVTAFGEWKAIIYTNKDPKAIAETHWFTSRKEATLEAIDAVLNYLDGNNQAGPLV